MRTLVWNVQYRLLWDALRSRGSLTSRLFYLGREDSTLNAYTNQIAFCTVQLQH